MASNICGTTLVCERVGQTFDESYILWGLLDTINVTEFPVTLDFNVVTIITKGEGSILLGHKLFKNGVFIREYPSNPRMLTGQIKDVFFLQLIGQPLESVGTYEMKSFITLAGSTEEQLLFSYPFHVIQQTVK